MSRCQHYECVLIYSKFEFSGQPENYDAERLSGECQHKVESVHMYTIYLDAERLSGEQVGLTHLKC